MLKPTQFLIYYRQANSLETIDDLPLCEPLMLAYKSSDHNVCVCLKIFERFLKIFFLINNMSDFMRSYVKLPRKFKSVYGIKKAYKIGYKVKIFHILLSNLSCSSIMNIKYFLIL